MSSESGKGENTRLRTDKWSPPAQGTLKINSDGAFSLDRGTGAIGAVVRDSSGSFREASARWLGHVGSALIAEAEAIQDDLHLITVGTGEHIVAKSDAQEAVSLGKNRTKQWSEISTILNEIEELASAFTSFEMIHVRREANFAAHSLASCSAACSLIVMISLEQ
jgi:ribonuclease HI